ncbi:hypothetical protein OAT82_01180 [Flavobacteriaceae bacterium]|nr:hypothetical protein [Flavobacteriaceae bacterium]
MPSIAAIILFGDIFGHHYDISKKVTQHVKEYTCTCCKKQMTTNGNGRLTELTTVFEDINSVLEYMHKRRSIRLNQKLAS